MGAIEGRRVALFQGRGHYYERGDAGAMRVAIDAFRKLGGETLMLTNAAGGLNTDWAPPSLVAITDHINFSGTNPLIGHIGNDRFVPLTKAYDGALRASLHDAARAAGVTLNDGVYMWFSGPSFETPAEIRAAKILGADLVGMSTVPEVILARRAGLRCAAVSVVTNYAAGLPAATPATRRRRPSRMRPPTASSASCALSSAGTSQGAHDLFAPRPLQRPSDGPPPPLRMGG